MFVDSSASVDDIASLGAFISNLALDDGVSNKLNFHFII